MMMRSFRWLAAAVLVTGLIRLGIPGRAAGAEGQATPAPKWWQKGQSRWVYMDDWTGLYLRGARHVKKTIDVPGPVKAAVIRFWSSGGGELVVNGKTIPKDPNCGPIRDVDLAPHVVQGANTIELRNVGEVVAEGGVVLADGREVLFATDESWAPGTRVQASRIRREGPRGYMGDYHVARPLAVTKAQKARFAVNQCNLARRRLDDDLRFAFWRRRDPAEMLTRDKPTDVQKQWRRVHALTAAARPAIEQAEQMILAGKCDEAMKAAAPAAEKTKQALRTYTELMQALSDGEARRMAAVMDRARPTADKYPHKQFNGSSVNRLGWVASCEPLDNDPAYWELDVAPPGAKTLALAGLWWFRVDPKSRGQAGDAEGIDFAADGFRRIFAPTKWGWERWGYTQQTGGAGVNKPYNGLAWYAKRLVVPESWKGSDLVLRLGDRWGNNDWLAVNGTWINAPESDQRGSNAGAFTIPARLIRFGKPNTLLLRVYNSSNIGGIINPGLRLSVAGREPRNLRSPVGPASVRECVFRTEAGEVTQIIYSSALSPAAVVTTTGRTIRLHGWSQCGYEQPRQFALNHKGKVYCGTAGVNFTFDTKDVRENWLLLWSRAKGPAAPRPLLIVFEKRPTGIHFTDGATDPAGVQLQYDGPGPRAALIRPLDESPGEELTAAQAERCRLWARALLRYPVGYTEQAAVDGDLCEVRMDYEYVALNDDWNTKPLPLAPLPMLLSYAMEHRWPGAKADGTITDLGCRARSGYYPQMDCGTYRAAVGQTHVTYQFDRMEPKRHLRGVGTLGEERRIGKEMFVNLHRWGFNSSRPQIPFHARDWDLFDRYARGGPDPEAKVKRDGRGWAFLDDMIAWHRERNMTCILNWFWDFGRGGFDEARADQIVAFWSAAAKRYAGQPQWAVAYSILNEPAGLPWEIYHPFAKRVTEAIRKHDKSHAISIEAGGGWAQPEDLDMTEPTGDENTTYQYHFYGPHKEEFPDNLLYPRYQRSEDRWRSYEGWEERMLSPIRFQIRHHRDVFHGEFGVSHLSAEGAAEGWLEDVLAIHHKYRMHWNWWHYNGGGTYRTGLVGPDHVNPLLAIMQKYAKMPPGKQRAGP
jgi:hypothetical protein